MCVDRDSVLPPDADVDDEGSSDDEVTVISTCLSSSSTVMIDTDLSMLSSLLLDSETDEESAETVLFVDLICLY